MVPEIEKGIRSPLDLRSLPKGIVPYYARYWQAWRDRHQPLWYNLHLPLLATLAIAPEAITVERLISWAGVDISVKELRGLLRGPWCPFVTEIGKGRASRFRLYHATFREIFTEQAERAYLAEAAREKLPATSVLDKLMSGEREFVLELQEETAEARRRIIAVLRAILLDPQVSSTERRRAASQLIRLRWLNEPDYRDDLMVTLELVASFLGSDLECRYLAQHLGTVLASPVLGSPDRDRVHLLVYLAAFHGSLHELREAADCYDRADAALAGLLASAAVVHDDHRLMARIRLGKANVLGEQAEGVEQAEPPNVRRGRKLRRAAQELFLLAAESARRYGQDPALLVNIEAELCLNAAFLRDWAEAEGAYRRAQVALAGIVDPDARSNRHAHLLESAGIMYYRWGQTLRTRCLDHYRAARDLAEQEIVLLDPAGPSEELAWAHSNCAEYWLALAQLTGDPGSWGAACRHWRSALDLATELSLPDLVTGAQGFLDQNCAGRAPLPVPGAQDDLEES